MKCSLSGARTHPVNALSFYAFAAMSTRSGYIEQCVCTSGCLHKLIRSSRFLTTGANIPGSPTGSGDYLFPWYPKIVHSEDVLIFLGKYTCNRDRCAFREEMFSGVMLAWRVLL